MTSITFEGLARRLPDDLWAAFEAVLPPVVWCGNGRPPCENRDCLHAVIYMGITGIGWKLLPPCFPCYKTVQGRWARWLEMDAFRQVWSACVARYELLRGINFDQLSIDGSRKPAKKGAGRPAPIRRTVASAARRSCWYRRPTICR
jgi:transposase